MSIYGAGIIFYDMANRRVLMYRRDDKPGIPCPNMIDLIGGHVDPGETPKHTIVREVAEELVDRRTGQGYRLENFHLFEIVPKHNYINFVFFKPVEPDFGQQLELLEGQYLLWVTEDDARGLLFAFDYQEVILKFFQSEHVRR